MPIDPQRLAQIMQRMQLARPAGPAPDGAQMGGAPMSPPDMAAMGGPPPGMAPQGVPMQINGTMTPQPQGMAPRPMMPPGGMPPR